MKNLLAFIGRRWPVYLALVISLLAATSYLKKVRDVYQAEAVVTIRRPGLDLPGQSIESSTNRWVWLRNGLSTRESLVTVSELRQLVSSDEIFAGRVDKAYRKGLGAQAASCSENESVSKRKRESSDSWVGSVLSIKNSIKGLFSDACKPARYTRAWVEAEMIRNLQEDIKIDFKGGDAYTFTFSFKDQNPLFAERVVQHFVERLRKLEINQPLKDYETSRRKLQGKIAQLQQRYKKLDPRLDSDQRKMQAIEKEINFFSEAAHRLSLMRLVQESESDRFVVVVPPHDSLDLVWPKPVLIYAAALVLGIVMGLILEFFVYGLLGFFKGSSKTEEDEGPFETLTEGEVSL